jgi:micrococcal nuclease
MRGVVSTVAAVAVVVTMAVGCTNQGSADVPVAVLRSGDSVRVVGIVKGDEVVVEKDGGQAHVRLLGVHAPEAVIDDTAVEKMSRPAKTFLSVKALDQRALVFIGTPAKDPHGRYLGYLTVDGVDINRELIQQGHALAYTEFGHEREADYMAADAQARAAGRGVWADVRTQKMLVGLRRVWSEGRKHQSGEAPVDPLLAPAVVPAP